jgi:hypothetical protein
MNDRPFPQETQQGEFMDWFDEPAAPVQPSPAPAAPGGQRILGSTRRTVVTALLAVGLLTVGGVAVVFAADPSASPAPTTTTQPSSGTGNGVAPNGGTTRPNGQAPRSHSGVNCPNMGGSGGSGGSTAPDGTAAPSTDGSTSSPSTSDL